MKRLFALAWFCIVPLILSVPPVAAQTTPAPVASTSEAPAATSVDALIKILENEKARQALIDRLRAASAEPAPPAETPTFARWLAERTTAASATLKDALAASWAFAQRLGEVLAGTATLDLPRLWNALAGLGAVMAVAFVLLFAARLVAERFIGKIAARAVASLAARLVLAVIAAAADALSVIVAWGAGYLIAMQFGAGVALNFGETLFLNALLVLELAKVALRLVLAPRHAALRPLPLDDTDANYWYFWPSRVVSLLGYTFLFVAPIVAANTTQAAAQAVRVIVVLACLLIGVAVVLQNRDKVRAKLASTGREWGHATRQVLIVLGRIWHVLAIVYLCALFVAWLSNPLTLLPFMLQATVESGIAVLAGSLVMAFITRALAGGMNLPAELRTRLPLLEARLNAFIPSVLRVARVTVLVIVLLVVANAWGMLDLGAWLASETGRNVVAALVSTSLVLVIGWFVYVAVSSWVEYRLSNDTGRVPSARERTLLALFRNAFTIVLAVIVGLLALSELGVNIGPLLAGAGVVGLAVSFGSQKLVQDIITGAFIQIENAMNEGEVVDLGSVSGVVEKLTIRSVGIRDLNGVYHLVPFSAVTTVSNFMRGFAFHVAEMGVSYNADIGEVKAAMQEAFERLAAIPDHANAIIGPLDMQGVTGFAASAVTVRARIRTIAGQQWNVGRAYNEILKQVFDERGIEIPYPHLTLDMGKQTAAEEAPMLSGQPPARAGEKQAPARSLGKRPGSRRKREKPAARNGEESGSG